MIPYAKHHILNSDIKAVSEVLRSDFLTQGPKVPLFEKKISKYVSSKYAVACNSATSALHLACMSINLKEGDLVWTTPITFVASANAALYCGAKVNFVDIDLHTFNICINSLQARLIDARKKNRLPKVLIVVHMAGSPCDMHEIRKLSYEYGFKVIEDASHAIGASYSNKKIGGCHYSDACIFSFHPAKIITTGEGGMLLTNDEEMFNKAQLLRTHGITKDNKQFQFKSHGPWYYEQHLLGFNFRMNDIEAALGISQFNRIDSYISSRNRIAKIYNEELSELNIALPTVLENSLSSFHLYIIRLLDPKHIAAKKNIVKKLHAMGVGVQIHYIPVNMQPFYGAMNIKDTYPNSNIFYSSAISLPMYPQLKMKEIIKVLDSLKEIIL